jgi:hypothetical protein
MDRVMAADGVMSMPVVTVDGAMAVVGAMAVGMVVADMHSLIPDAANRTIAADPTCRPSNFTCAIV